MKNYSSLQILKKSFRQTLYKWSLLCEFNLCVKVKNEYVAIPLGYKMWIDKKSKLEIAADFIDEIMSQLADKKVILTFDALYAKKELINHALHHKNLEIICNVRSDTVMYELHLIGQDLENVVIKLSTLKAQVRC